MASFTSVTPPNPPEFESSSRSTPSCRYSAPSTAAAQGSRPVGGSGGGAGPALPLLGGARRHALRDGVAGAAWRASGRVRGVWDPATDKPAKPPPRPPYPESGVATAADPPKCDHRP